MKFDQTGFNVESGSDKEDTSNNNDPNMTMKNTDAHRKRKLGKRKLGNRSGSDKNIQPTPQANKQEKVIEETECERGKKKDGTTTPNNTNKNKPRQKQTKRETAHRQSTLKFDQTGFNVESGNGKEDTSNNNDPNLTMKNTDAPRKRKLGKRKL